MVGSFHSNFREVLIKFEETGKDKVYIKDVGMFR